LGIERSTLAAEKPLLAILIRRCAADVWRKLSAERPGLNWRAGQTGRERPSQEGDKDKYSLHQVRFDLQV
jgi:hypothetical protein